MFCCKVLHVFVRRYADSKSKFERTLPKTSFVNAVVMQAQSSVLAALKDRGGCCQNEEAAACLLLLRSALTMCVLNLLSSLFSNSKDELGSVELGN